MDEKIFDKLAGLAAIATLAESTELPGQETASAGEVVLEDNNLLVAFDPNSGALTRMERKSSHWKIERRPELGASFRLLAPLPQQRANFVLGEKQRATKVEKVSDNQIKIVWKDPVSEHGGVVPLTFTATVTLQNGALTFDSTLENDSSLWIETIDYPYFGDLNSPTRDTPVQAGYMQGGALQGKDIYPHFGNEKGYWGVRFPTKTIDSTQSQFCFIQTPLESIYVGMHDPAIRYLLQFTFEQHPGFVEGDAIDVPQQDEISGIPVHLEFRTCHFVFARPRSSVKLAPIVIRTYSGDWQKGIDIYKEWRATWFTAPKIPAWASDIHSWLELQLDTPVEDYSVPYRKLVQYGSDCAKSGIAAIQLVGWNRGGHDRGGPSQDTEPGLGTWGDLHSAIAQIQAQGVKTILFAQLYWADWTTEWYKKELYKYQATDPYGNGYLHNPEGYIMPIQLAGINLRRCTIMDVLSPAYREIAAHEFEKILDLGAAGWFHGGVSDHSCIYSFGQDHGYAAPGYLYAGDIPLSRLLHAATERAGRDFLFAGESPQDWLMPYYPMAHLQINAGSKLICRYLDSKTPLIVSVTGLDDRETLNLILLYRCIISYKPANFGGRLSDFPLTLAYGQKIDALRRRYRKYLWDAEFRDHLGVTVDADGAYRHTVFRTIGGKRAVVVVNMESSKAITATINMPNAGELMSATPEDPDARSTPATLNVPMRSVIIAMEQ